MPSSTPIATCETIRQHIGRRGMPRSRRSRRRRIPMQDETRAREVLAHEYSQAGQPSVALAIRSGELRDDSPYAVPIRAMVVLRQDIINTPETADFMAGVPLEAAHQRERWKSEHDAGKTPFDWFWL